VKKVTRYTQAGLPKEEIASAHGKQGKPDNARHGLS
jgi:hypothetical protein